jgi:hypothetical protein
MLNLKRLSIFSISLSEALVKTNLATLDLICLFKTVSQKNGLNKKTNFSYCQFFKYSSNLSRNTTETSFSQFQKSHFFNPVFSKIIFIIFQLIVLKFPLYFSKTIIISISPRSLYQNKTHFHFARLQISIKPTKPSFLNCSLAIL